MLNHYYYDKNATRKQLEYHLENGYKIIIDTNSLMEESADDFWRDALPVLRKHNARILVLKQVRNELEKHIRNKHKNPRKAKLAAHAYKTVKTLYDQGYIKTLGDDVEEIADNTILRVFQLHKQDNNLLLITGDKDSTWDVLNMAQQKSVRSRYSIHVLRIDQNGCLKPPKPYTPDNQINSFKKNAEDKIKRPDPCSCSAEVTTVPDERIPVSHIPGMGEQIWVNHGQWHPLQLLEKIGEGKESVIYTTNTPLLAKIYKAEAISTRKEEKIRLMLSQSLAYPGICFPAAGVYNEDRQFIGFLMPRAEGTELQRSLFLPKPVVMKHFPDWKKRDVVELCITILEKIQYLHDCGIIMGDINPANILVKSPKEVYFVDTDSYQIGSFPCPVGMVNFTAPEIQGKPFNSFLRTPGNEYFAIATLLFMILMMGKTPYAQQGGTDPVRNIMNMEFSYRYNDQRKGINLYNGKRPEGEWGKLWSHLPHKVKSYFYFTFSRGEVYATENTRLSEADWFSLLRWYLNYLDNHMCFDPMSEELYPTSYKTESPETKMKPDFE